MVSLRCSWLGLNLLSPLLLASLTLFSKPDIEMQTEYYLKCAQLGAGAIILPSVNPSASDLKKSYVRTEAVYSGLQDNQPMGFTILGPTSNLAKVSYLISLIRRLEEKKISIPILASVANMGNKEEFLQTIQDLSCENIQGFELNFSCPNILTLQQGSVNLTRELLREIKKITRSIPISIKLPPGYDFTPLLSGLSDEVQGFTLSNANTGLLPPQINNPLESLSPFPNTERWSPTGVYGPHERLSTLNTLYNFVKSQTANKKNFFLSSVGGYVKPEHVIQAIMLGADTVQLSSAIAWNGLISFRSFNEFIMNYLGKHNFHQLNDIRRIAIPLISPSADEAMSPLSQDIVMQVEDCRKCQTCRCCNKMCYAITQVHPNTTPRIDKSLCSGCGWCKQQCPYNAIRAVVND